MNIILLIRSFLELLDQRIPECVEILLRAVNGTADPEPESPSEPRYVKPDAARGGDEVGREGDAVDEVGLAVLGARGKG